MKISVKYLSLYILVIIIFQVSASAQSLNENLNILKPLMGKTWTGILPSPDGSGGWKIERRFETMCNGEVIKVTKINVDRNKKGEGYFYWNDIEKKIALFFIEEDGVFLTGFVSADADSISIEGTMTWPTQMNPNVKQQYEFKNTFEFTPDGGMIDRWFMNAFGPWRPGHVIEFKNENN